MPRASTPRRTFTDVDGHRYQVFLTDHLSKDITFLEALYPGRFNSRTFPSQSFAVNAAWLSVVLMAGDLLTWTKCLYLEGDLARAEPRRLHYTLLRAAGIVVRSARRSTLRLAEGWPRTTSSPPSAVCRAGRSL